MIIFIHAGSMEKCPPALSAFTALLELGYKVKLISMNIPQHIKELCEQFNAEYISYANDDHKCGLLKKFIYMHSIRKKLWKDIKKHSTSDTVIWISSLDTLKYLGEKNLPPKKYVLHLLEYTKELYFTPKVPFLKFNAQKICDNALKVVMCEENRAHISKAQWALKELPVVLPNKPNYYKQHFFKNMPIKHSTQAANLINQLKSKKILLYQGILIPERPLDGFIKAAELLGKDYAFVVMSNHDFNQYYVSSENTFVIDFIPPPYHLEITSHAYIGLMSYNPQRVTKIIGNSINLVYCAPNKIFEYSMFGLPMIGDDLPGLSIPLKSFACGLCVDVLNPKEICQAVLEIDKNYDRYAANSSNFFASVDFNQIIKGRILGQRGN